MPLFRKPVLTAVILTILIAAPAAAQQPVQYVVVVPRTGASLGTSRSDVPRIARGPAPGAHESIVPRTICRARVREERLRPSRLRRQGRRAHAVTSQSVRVGPHGPRRHHPHRLQGVRRSCRWHVPRHRHHARAHEHAGDADVGARARRTADPHPLRAAARPRMDSGHAALSDAGGMDVHRAQPPVPDGQPDGAERADHPDVQGPQSRRQGADYQDGSASRCDGRRHRRVPRGRGEDRERGRRDLRRVPGVRARHVHVSRRLCALGRRRRNGASQQHCGRVPDVDQRRRQPRVRNGRARILPLLERRADSSENARTVQLRGGEHLRRAVARRRVHAGTTASSCCSARASGLWIAQSSRLPAAPTR